MWAGRGEGGEKQLKEKRGLKRPSPVELDSIHDEEIQWRGGRASNSTWKPGEGIRGGRWDENVNKSGNTTGGESPELIAGTPERAQGRKPGSMYEPCKACGGKGCPWCKKVTENEMSGGEGGEGGMVSMGVLSKMVRELRGEVMEMKDALKEEIEAELEQRLGPMEEEVKRLGGELTKMQNKITRSRHSEGREALPRKSRMIFASSKQSGDLE